MSSNDPRSEGKAFSQSKQQKTCFLEDLEEDTNKGGAGLGRKSRRKLEQEVFTRRHNSTRSTNESSIAKTNFSASTPDIYSSSTSPTEKKDLQKSTKGKYLSCIMYKLGCILYLCYLKYLFTPFFLNFPNDSI